MLPEARAVARKVLARNPRHAGAAELLRDCDRKLRAVTKAKLKGLATLVLDLAEELEDGDPDEVAELFLAPPSELLAWLQQVTENYESLEARAEVTGFSGKGLEGRLELNLLLTGEPREGDEHPRRELLRLSRWSPRVRYWRNRWVFLDAPPAQAPAP
jgi:hypothetical protein